MFQGWEWIIIGVVAIVIILWGPSKIPQLARSLGLAKGEFKKASKESADTINSPMENKKLSSKDEILMKTANNLGISTSGKSREQLAGEIDFKLKSLSSD
jgi:sec-independent protein translocase protein TatA